MTTKPDFETIHQKHGYALECVFNGNLSEAIRYLREMANYGVTGVMIMTEELFLIRDLYPDRYSFIRDKVFTYDLKFS